MIFLLSLLLISFFSSYFRNIFFYFFFPYLCFSKSQENRVMEIWLEGSLRDYLVPQFFTNMKAEAYDKAQ